MEELFGSGVNTRTPAGPEWAWQPRVEPCRYWEAEVNGLRLLYPVEAPTLNAAPHDGVWQDGIGRDTSSSAAKTTLVVACCDPAAGLHAAEYARACGFRLLVLPRGGTAALDLLKRGLVHAAVAGTAAPTSIPTITPRQCTPTWAAAGDCCAWPVGRKVWHCRRETRTRSVRAVIRRAPRWALREAGSAARECLDELLASQRASGLQGHSHTAVAEAVRAGWAEAGVCVRLAAGMKRA